MAATTASPRAPAAPANLAAAMANVSLSPPSTTAPPTSARSPSVRLSVPHDAKPATREGAGLRTTGMSSTAYPERKLVRRDSTERRDALLKGKEGSRQRRRWENDRLLSNPWAAPPLPSDWEVRPTYPRRTVPYYLAPLWDAAEFQRAVEAKMRGRKGSMRTGGTARKHGSSMKHPGMSPIEEAAAAIPKEVKARLKRSKAAKGLLQDLEEEVRGFVRAWNEREMRRGEGLGTGSGRDRSETLDSQMTEESAVMVSEDEEDEEIVFVGRNGTMQDGLPKREEKKELQVQQQQLEQEWQQTISREKLVFEACEDDKGASFARWLVHCVGNYYGLRTWSVTREIEGSDNRREAYVGIDERATGLLGRGVEVGKEIELPRPLWGMV